MSDFSVAPISGVIGRSGYVRATSVTSGVQSEQRAAIVDTVELSAAAREYVTTSVTIGPTLSQTVTDLTTATSFRFVPGDYTGTLFVEEPPEDYGDYEAFYADTDEVPFSADVWSPSDPALNNNWGILPLGQQIDTLA